jgi:uncharacterized protein YfaS (alpha-2-macroglobulin family)
MTRKHTKSIHFSRTTTALAISTMVVAACLRAPALHGEEPASRSAVPAESAAAAPVAPLAVTLAGATCDACEPEEMQLVLTFTQPVRPSAVAGALRASPPVALRPVGDDTPTAHVLLDGDFAERRTYHFTVPDTLRGAAGEVLAAPLAFAVTTGAFRPIARMPVGQAVLPVDAKFPVQTRHARRARLRLYPLGRGDLDAAARITGVHAEGSDPVPQLPVALRMRGVTLRPDVVNADANGVQDIDVFAAVGVTGARTTPVLAVLDAEGTETTVTVVQRAELGVVLKVGRGDGLVWVTDGRTGEPVAGAEIAIEDGAVTRFRGRTQADGVLRLPARARLERTPADLAREARQREARRARPGADDVEDFEGDDEEAYYAGRIARPLRAVVVAGTRTAFASTVFDTGAEPWRFPVEGAWREEAESLRGMVTAERGIYRPGEPLHLLGVLRRRLPSGTLVPSRGKVNVRVMDPDGSEVFRDDAALTAFGTFHVEDALPRAARLGTYSIEVKQGEAALHATFEVGEYRAASFEVTLPPAGALERGASGDVRVPVRAAYLYGAPVRGGRVSWSASVRARSPHFAELASFAFGGEDEGGTTFLTGGELTLDTSGTGTVTIPADALRPAFLTAAQAVDLLVEASVTDASDDTFSARTVQSLPPPAALVGVERAAQVFGAEGGWDVRIATVDARGTPVRGQKLVATLVRSVWESAAEEGPGGPSYDVRRVDSVVATRALVSEGAPLRVHFDLPGSGEYRVEAHALAASGEELPGLASASAWVYGAGPSYGPAREDALLPLRADRESYAPGDTAHLAVESPFAHATALFTVEREGILEARVVRLEGASTPLAVRLDAAHLPNVYAAIALVPRAHGGAAPAAGAPVKFGATTLTVSAESRRLEVAVTPTQAELRPGDTAEVEVRVKDAAGRPARAEVTLWAADEGVLALTGYETPDPFAPAWAPHPHAVANASNYLRWTTRTPDDWDDGGIGDAGPGEAAGAALRSRFLATAFFARPVVTDARGTARVRFPLPDNLTRWRVLAAVADAGERFGKGEAALRTRKPLQVTPALPRFLTQGDVVDAGVVVHDATGVPGPVDVQLSVRGGTLLGPASQRVEIPADGQLALHVPLRADRVGDVVVEARVGKRGEQDGFSLTLPAHAPTGWQSKVLADGILGDGYAEGRARVAVTIPEGVTAGSAELVVTYAPSVLASIESGIEALVEYPNGCVEQTTSGLIPLVLLEDLLRGLGSARFDGARHRARMEEAIAHVLVHQNDDGGFGLWPSSDSEGFLTAYALWGLLIARDHGYAVPRGRLDAGLAYLSAHRGESHDMHGQFSTRETAPFSAFVLAYASRDDGGLGTTLRAGRAGLSRFGLGLLATALERREARAAELLGELDAARTAREGGGTLIADPNAEAGFMAYGRDLRATGSAVQALVAAGRARDAAALVNGILAERRADGTWGTTYNNLWAILALSTYAEATAASPSAPTVVVRLDGRELARTQFRGHSGLETLHVPYAELVRPDGRPRELELLAPPGADVRYTARLRFSVDLAHQRPASEGLAVTRTLVDAETGAPVSSPRLGQLLRVRLTLRSTEAREQVALTDRLPAGLEPIDTRLATEQRRVEAGGDPWVWQWRELHDERVAFFADYLPAGTTEAEYLARATRSGSFVRPAAGAEAMYDPSVHARGATERLEVTR